MMVVKFNTLPPTIMVQWKMSPPQCLFSFNIRVMFHSHDCGREGNLLLRPTISEGGGP